MFVYPSLSHTLLSGVFISFLALIAFLSLLKRPNAYKLSVIHFVVLLWMIYIGFWYILFSSESYRVFYLLTTLWFGVVLSVLLQEGYIAWRQVENVLLCMAIIHCLYAIVQIFKPASSFPFVITGCSDNPSTTAIYLSCCVIILLQRISENRAVYTIFLVVLILVILLLRCRAAYLGLFLILSILLYKKSRHHVCAIVGIVLLAALFSLGLFHFKKASSEGHVLIWKLTAQMIAKKPQGYGYGLFEKNYNLQQADYFADGSKSIAEVSSADVVFMPYNDVMEHAVEGGLAGALLLILFYLSIVWVSVRNKDQEVSLVASVLFCMLMVNFVYTSPSVWLLLLCFAGKAMATDDSAIDFKPHRSIPLFALALSVALFCREVRVAKSQLQLAQLNELIQEGRVVRNDVIGDLASDIETSEAYYIALGKNYIRQQQYNQAIDALNKARCLTSSPTVFQLLFHCYDAMGQKEPAIDCLKTIGCMLPHHIWPKILLMRTYDSYGNTSQAKHLALDILHMPVKIQSEKAKRFQNEAHHYIESHEE